MVDVPIYLGRPGSFTELPHPRGGVRSTRVRDTAVFNLGSGGRRTHKTANGKRVYLLAWDSLDLDTFATVQAFQQGHNGPGPFVLIDPGQRNQLSANQSSATSLLNTTRDFTRLGGVNSTLNSDAAVYLRGPRSLRWDFGGTDPDSTLELAGASASWPGIPVVPGHEYTFTVYLRGTATLAAVPKLKWLDSAGVQVSLSTGSTVVPSPAAWTQGSVVGTVPAGGYYVLPRVVVPTANIAAGRQLWVDQPMLQLDGAVSALWTPGTGLVPVDPLDLPEQWAWGFPGYRQGPAAAFQEVGA